MKELEKKKIPPQMDYACSPGLSNELKAKLARIEPATIGQAERIPGMTQAAVMAILITIRKWNWKHRPLKKKADPRSGDRITR